MKEMAMDKRQELKMQILDKFANNNDQKTVDFCRKVYEFVIEDNDKPAGEYNKYMESRIEFPQTEQAVDLGLPSGTLWCDRNIGAKSTEDYGAFFSWGNVEPHFTNKENMDWGDDDYAFDYKFNSENYKQTPGYKLEGDIDLEHDAARVNMGEPWQMPTSEQMQELFDNCTWTRKTVNGVNGYLVSSKINDNSIFFPCSGLGYGTSWSGRGSYGLYWSSSLYSATNGRSLDFYSGGVVPQGNYNRFYGFAVRAVQNNV